MSVEAMKQALEALQEVYWSSRSAKHDEAITAIKQALAAPVQEPVAWVEKNGDVVWQNYKAAIGRNLYTTPPAQEFLCSTGLCHFTLTQTNVGIGERATEAYEAAKERGWVGVYDERLMEMPKQEPVAFVTGTYAGRFLVKPLNSAMVLPVNMALYTTPQTVMMDQTYHDHATELLQRCENEMRYAGWDKYESDNTAKNGVYEQVKHFLEKNT